MCKSFYFIRFEELQSTWSANRAVQIWFDNKNSRRVRGLDKDPYISILIQKSPFIYSRCFLLDWIQKFLLPYHCWQNWRNFPKNWGLLFISTSLVLVSQTTLCKNPEICTGQNSSPILYVVLIMYYKIMEKVLKSSTGVLLRAELTGLRP